MYPYTNLSQMYVGEVNINTKQANKIAGAVHSKCPLFCCRLSTQRLIISL